MTFTPLRREERAEWRSMLSPAENTRTLAAALMFIFSSLVLVFCQSMTVASIYLLYAVFFYYTLTRSFLSLLILAIPGVFLMPISAYCADITYALALPAAYAALLLGGVCGAFLILQFYRSKRNCVLLAFLPIALYLVSFLVCRSLRLSLLSLIPTALALVLALCMLYCRPHTPSVLTVSAVCVLLALATILVSMHAFGNLSGNPVQAMVELLRAGIVRMYTTAMELNTAEGITLPVTERDVQNLAAVIGNLSPALLLICCALLAYAMWRMLLRMMVEWQVLPRVPMRLAVLTVSPYAAGVFAVAFLASLIANASEITLFGMLCENLSMVLEPPLILVGFSSLSPRHAPSCLSQLLALGLIALLFVNLSLGLALTACLGAFHILWSRFAPRDKGEK